MGIGSRPRLTRRGMLGIAVSGIGVTAVGGLLAACSSTPPSPTAAVDKPAASADKPAGATPAAASQPVAASDKKATGWTAKSFTTVANDVSAQLIKKYAANNGWDIELSDLPTDLMPKLLAGLESGQVPDFVQLGAGVAQLHATDGLQDVSPILKELEAENGAPVPLATPPALYKGKWLAVPWYSYTDGWFVRRDVFEKKGIKLEDLTTYEKFRDLGLEVSDPASSFWGWGLTVASGTGDGKVLCRHQLNCWGASVVDESGEKVVLNSPEAVEAVRWLADVFTNPKWKKMLPPGILSWDDAGNNEHLIGGKVAYIFNSSGAYWAAKNQKSPYFKDIAVRSFPVGPSKKELVGGYPFFHTVFKKSKNRDFATGLAKFMAQPAQSFERMRVAEGQSWPVYQKLIDAAEVREAVKADPGFEQLLKNATHPSGWSVGWPGALTPGSSAIESQGLIPKMYEAVIAGQVTPEQSVKETAGRAEELLKAFRQ